MPSVSRYQAASARGSRAAIAMWSTPCTIAGFLLRIDLQPHQVAGDHRLRKDGPRLLEQRAHVGVARTQVGNRQATNAGGEGDHRRVGDRRVALAVRVL